MIKLLSVVFSWILISTPLAIASTQHHSGSKPSKNSSVILVDKKTNLLHVAEYDESTGDYQFLKTYHTTLGKVKGDKEDENDLKTPEGIYHFIGVKTPPRLQAKFGVKAFPMDFPNAFDRLAGRTGNGIMMHGTDVPERLKLNYDSEGCVVVKNEEIQEITPHIRLGLTPILIFPELTEEYKHPGKDTQLKQFFQTWISDWESKNVDGYISHYHSDFSANGKQRQAWKAYKTHLNSVYSKIEINPENIRFYRHPKYSVITFTQNYRSKLKSGGWGHRSTGTKALFVAEEQQQPRIIAETFSNLMW